MRNAELVDFSLYNVESDPGESVDLASQNPEVLQSFTTKMKQIYQDLTTQMHVWPAK